MSGGQQCCCAIALPVSWALVFCFCLDIYDHLGLLGLIMIKGQLVTRWDHSE